MALTGLDIMVAFAVGVAALFGLKRGFVVEIASFAAWLGGLFAVRIAFAPVSAWLLPVIGTTTGAAVLAVLLVFAVVFLAIKLAGRALGTAARGTVLGPVDRLLGLGFGALKGLVVATLAFLVISLALNLTTASDAPRPDWITEAHSYPLLRASSEALIGLAAGDRKR